MGAALDVRGVPSAGNLTAEVEGDVEDVGGIMRITRIRIRYRFKIQPGTKEKIERVLDTYAEHCPAYQSVKGCIECTWEAEMREVT